MTADQQQAALRMLQALIIQARFEAFEVGANEVGELLDDLELLPVFIAENRTEDFDLAIQGVIEKHPECRYVLKQSSDQPAIVG